MIPISLRPWRRRGTRPRRGCGPRRRGGRAGARHGYLHIVYKHGGHVAKAILMHQELDADGLACPRAEVPCLIDPTLAVGTLMVDDLEDVAAGIGDVRILPIEHDAVSGAVPMPEA